MSSAEADWEAAWPEALAAWSRYTRLRAPTLCMADEQALGEGLSGSFAMIRLDDQRIIINLADVERRGLSGYATEILAHEIGHHVFAPATLTEHARLIACLRPGLPGHEHHAPMLANLYTDLLINDRLQRSAGLRMDQLMAALKSEQGASLWTLYLRIYERLWQLDRGSLTDAETSTELEGDAWLGARLLRVYARDWLAGAGRFAALLLPYLIADAKAAEAFSHLMDTGNAAGTGLPDGLTDIGPDESAAPPHPAQDPQLNGLQDAQPEPEAPAAAPREQDSQLSGERERQARDPFTFGEILRAAGVRISPHDIAIHYYRERARKHLVRFPRRAAERSSDPLPEGLELWDLGQSLESIDWMQSVMQSPQVIPGLTTVQRVWGASPGREARFQAADLDLFVDCSGSMPNPQQQLSFTALAGAILCLSALRADARVRVTLWSGRLQFKSTPGFVSDEYSVLHMLTSHIGGATAFPIHILRETYATPRERPTHIVVLSDDGITTMFDQDELGNSGWSIATTALRNAGAGGTLVLQLWEDWEQHAVTASDWRGELRRLIDARDRMGWDLHPMSSWDQLIDFAKAFNRRHHQPSEATEQHH